MRSYSQQMEADNHVAFSFHWIAIAEKQPSALSERSPWLPAAEVERVYTTGEPSGTPAAGGTCQHSARNKARRSTCAAIHRHAAVVVTSSSPTRYVINTSPSILPAQVATGRAALISR